MNFLITIVLFVMLFIIDQLTKYLSQLYLVYGATQSTTFIPNVISLRLEYNNGAAFSAFNDSGWLLIIISAVAAVVLGYYCLKNNWKREKFKSFTLTMVMAGCVGNLYDRIIMNIPGLNDSRPGVVDMIEFQFLDVIWENLFKSSFATSNVADVYLVVGLILFAIDLIFFADRRKKKYELEDRKKVRGY